MKVQFEYNGVAQEHEVHPGTLLSELLGEDVTAVLLDGRLVRTEMLLAAQAHQRQLVSRQGVQIRPDFLPSEIVEPYTCAQVLNAHLLSQQNPRPSVDQIKEAFVDLFQPALAATPRALAANG